jgi:AcrR family transcriptional regulator
MSVGTVERRHELRERILDATLRVIRERGMTRTRTSAIAEAAGCAEGTIYRYFTDKHALLHEAVRCRLPDAVVLPGLVQRAGTRTVRENLLDATNAAIRFYTGLMPLAAGVLADAELWDDESCVEGSDLGARQGVNSLAAYVRSEQELGRIRESIDPDAVARVLLDVCLGESFLDALTGTERRKEQRARSLHALVEILAGQLEPS